MNQRAKEQLRNTVTVSTSKYGDGDYVTPPEGRHDMALIKIKNCVMNTQWGDKEGYRFIFRLRQTPEAFVSIEETAKCNRNAGLYRLGKSLSDGAIPDSCAESPEDLFNFMQRFLDHWFTGVITYKHWAAKDGTDVIFARIEQRNIQPSPNDKQWGNAAVFFDKVSKEKEDKGALPGSQTGFEDPGDPTPEEKSKEEKGQFVDNWGLFMYEVAFSKDKAVQEKQSAFLSLHHGVYNNDTGWWHFPKEVKDLEKRFKGFYETKTTPVAEVTFDDDNIPW